MKVALVYDRVNKIGGAERVLEIFHKIWPDAPLFTAVYDRKKAIWAKDFKVIPSFLDKIPLAKSNHELYPWLTPLAFEGFSFDEYDLVISLTSAEAKGIITKPSTFHLCYCLTPTRYLWIKEKSYLENPGFGVLNPLIRLGFRASRSRLKKWDLIASQRPDCYLAISKLVKQRIRKYYRREAEVIYPPVDIKRFQKVVSAAKLPFKDYFLLVSRLVAYKKVELAIEAFNRLGLPLVIVGTGNLEGPLKKMAKKNIHFLGQLTDDSLVLYYQNCKALIMPQEEDFGLVALEAQAAGKPVITFKRSGASEVVKEGKTGEFFLKQDIDELAKIIRKFNPLAYKAVDCQRNAEKYGLANFKKKFKKFIPPSRKTEGFSSYALRLRKDK